uniref:PDZ domain-containing protein n=1 Tax=Noctiluca scintillans TaxID=2966 RepID=A0A7S1F0U6_NOCSC|mmetsp:Transcript_24380/g.64125  ORF Transcript_24380/g.64125 Transcript_24380/m.64125 type:complete len:139 (+) Transcript_24380:47-463(+)
MGQTCLCYGHLGEDVDYTPKTCPPSNSTGSTKASPRGSPRTPNSDFTVNTTPEVLLTFELPNGLEKTVVMTRRPFGLKFTSAPFLVNHVNRSGYAESLGIRVGWRLTRVDETVVSSLADLQRQLRKKACLLPLVAETP